MHSFARRLPIIVFIFLSLTIGLSFIQNDYFIPVSHPRVGFYTYIASNDVQYVKLAALQHFAFTYYAPEQAHHILVSNKTDPKIARWLQSINATVKVIEPFRDHQDKKGPSNWVDQLTKIKLWNLTQHELVCYLDADVMLFADVGALLADNCLEHTNNLTDICAFEQGCRDRQVSWN